MSVCTDEKPFSCSVSKENCAHKYFLPNHITTHTDERPFSCNVCNKTFGRKSYLTSHIRIHTGEKPISCIVCNKTFASISGMTKHLLRTHRDKKPFLCNACNKSFARKQQWKLHVKIHSEEKTFSCSVCKKSFPWKSWLTKHMKAHTGKNPFSCSVCKKDFARKSGMSKHMKVHKGGKLSVSVDRQLLPLNTCSTGSSQKVTVSGNEIKGTNVCDKKLWDNNSALKSRLIEHIKSRKHVKRGTSVDVTPNCRAKGREETLNASSCSKIKSEDDEEHPYICTTSSNRNPSQVDLTDPTNPSSDGKLFSCCLCSTKNSEGWCGVDIDSDSTLMFCKQCQHVSTSCVLCHKKVQLWFLRTHVGLHMGEAVTVATTSHTILAPSWNFLQEPRVCKKDFSWKSGMSKHMKVHKGGKPASVDKQLLPLNTCSTGSSQKVTISGNEIKGTNVCDKKPFMFKLWDNNSALKLKLIEHIKSQKHVKHEISVDVMPNCRAKGREETLNASSCSKIKSEDDEEHPYICTTSSNRNPSQVDLTDPTNPSSDGKLFSCCLCSTKNSESWCGVDIDSDSTLMFCKQCQHVSTSCVLCHKKVQLWFLRTHVGLHMGEAVTVATTSHTILAPSWNFLQEPRFETFMYGLSTCPRLTGNI